MDDKKKACTYCQREMRGKWGSGACPWKNFYDDHALYSIVKRPFGTWESLDVIIHHCALKESWSSNLGKKWEYNVLDYYFGVPCL